MIQEQINSSLRGCSSFSVQPIVSAHGIFPVATITKKEIQLVFYVRL